MGGCGQGGCRRGGVLALTFNDLNAEGVLSFQASRFGLLRLGQSGLERRESVLLSEQVGFGGGEVCLGGGERSTRGLCTCVRVNGALLRVDARVTGRVVVTNRRAGVRALQLLDGRGPLVLRHARLESDDILLVRRERERIQFRREGGVGEGAAIGARGGVSGSGIGGRRVSEAPLRCDCGGLAADLGLEARDGSALGVDGLSKTGDVAIGVSRGGHGSSMPVHYGAHASRQRARPHTHLTSLGSGGSGANAPDLEIIDLAVKGVLSGDAAASRGLCVVSIGFEVCDDFPLLELIVLGGREVRLGSRQVDRGLLCCLRPSDRSGPCRLSVKELARGFARGCRGMMRWRVPHARRSRPAAH